MPVHTTLGHLVKSQGPGVTTLLCSGPAVAAFISWHATKAQRATWRHAGVLALETVPLMQCAHSAPALLCLAADR